MRIHTDTCIGCGRCRSWCSMGCISFMRTSRRGRVCCTVDENECVDCGICLRANVCPTDSLEQPEYPYPRSLRSTFSNPKAEHKETRVPGRGTEEMKTNDVTNRYQRGFAAIAAEMGRPGTGTRMSDVEKVFRRLAPLGVTFEHCNPLTSLLQDEKTGDMRPEVLDEKVLSCIIEMLVPLDRLIPVLDTLDEAAREIDTVFSVDVTARTEADGSVPTERLLRESGRSYAVNGKTNIGLGQMTIKGANR